MPVPLNLTQLFTNNAVSLLVAPISATATSLTVMPGHGVQFPQPTGDGSDFFFITLEDQGATVREIIKVTGRTGDTLTFALSDRGQDGTVPLAWTSAVGADTLVDHRITAETLRRLQQLPVQTPSGSSWINGQNTLSTSIDPGWQLPISSATYSGTNRSFKFMVTVTHSASHLTRAFEIMLTISGNLNANAEVVHANQYSAVGPKIEGDLHALLNTGTKTLSLEWQNNEAQPVSVHVTRIQHFPV